MTQDNNGWIKIESKEDLPPTGCYWVVNLNGEIMTMIRSNGIVNDNEYWLNNLAYYQQFAPKKPQPPIY